MKEIDARGLQCPQPVILTKKALEEIGEGEVLVIVDNITARENIIRLATNLKNEYGVVDVEGCYHIKINKGTNLLEYKHNKNEETVIVIMSDKLGKGDDILGNVLMKGYLYTLSEAAPLPRTIIFINSGVKLAVEGSEALEHLNKLAEMGVEIISCGTCLDYYGLKESLKAGIVGNMYMIVEKMNSAIKIINIG